MDTLDILKLAKQTSLKYGKLSTVKINEALLEIYHSLLANKDSILNANKIDYENAKGKLSEAMLDRLYLDENRIIAMANGVKALIELPDPCGKIIEEIDRPNGLKIKKVSVPMGVIAVIYESRPNVTSDVASLVLKSGSVSVLRTSKDDIHSAKAIVDAIHQALDKVDIPRSYVNLVESTSHEDIDVILHANKYVDLLIPRGGKNLIERCVNNSSVPCIHTGNGICHIYVDEDADIQEAVNIVENAKTSRVSTCNTEEVLLVNEKIAKEFLPLLKQRLVDDRKINKVELRLDEKAIQIIDGKSAGKDDFDTEFLDYILAVKVVKDVDEAIEHINAHSTGHSESIVTRNNEHAEKFLNGIDSAVVYVNASTRFSDGGEFGMGCEIGISTQKLHARGPMGLKELTTYKYYVYGNGQVR